VALVKVARVEEIPPGCAKYLTLESGPVILANFQGRVYALAGICPHQENPLEGATMWGHLIDCPWHHFQFDCRSGENYFPRNVYPEGIPNLEKQVRPLKTYGVELREGDVWVNLE
jgi:3-phenylpropionate/trans-cinnamate dioxygenase ferredoxin subunit